jgi:GNAT superfamily N-acetyltransferase
VSRAATRSIDIRRAGPADLPEIIDVCGQALGWDPTKPNEEFFRWKHLENPFGESPMWVANDGDSIVAVRTMMRWRFRHHPTGEVMNVVRAVDTATLPSHQGQGLFTTLTMAAVEELTAEGVAAVFNTPNDKSRPGYLKMGWVELGRVPIRVRPRTPMALVKIARSRVAADKWGETTTVGLDPLEALADQGAVADLLATATKPDGWTTDLSLAVLRWRYGLGHLNYRVARLGQASSHGFIVFRVRRRGHLREMTVAEVVAPPGDGPSLRTTLVQILADCRSDVALGTERGVLGAALRVPLPRQGPLLTWRALAKRDVPDLSALLMPLGAVELF